MNKLILALIVVIGIHLCTDSSALAQNRPVPTAGVFVKNSDSLSDQQLAIMNKQIDSVKKQLLAANLTLSEAEAAKFWPVYDQYSAEFKKITDIKSALIKEYADGYGSLTDEQADSLMQRWLDSDIAVFELRRKYLPIFRRVLNGRITATFFQLEHRISTIVDLQLTSQLPLMQGQDDVSAVQ